MRLHYLTDEISVRMNCNKNSIYLPTGSSPENDEQNDLFYPLNSTGAGSKAVNALLALIFYTISFVCGNEQLVSFDGNFLLLR